MSKKNIHIGLIGILIVEVYKLVIFVCKVTCPGTLGTFDTSTLVVGTPGNVLTRAPALPE